SPVWGQPLLEFIGVVKPPSYGRFPFTGHFPWEVGAVSVAICAGHARSAPWALRAALSVVLTALFAWLCFRHDLARTGAWSVQVMWAYILVVVVASAYARRIDGVQVLVLLLAWMAMLSRGYPVPALMVGSMTLAAAKWAFDMSVMPAALRARAATASAVAVAAFALTGVSAAAELHARRADPYYDQPASRLTASVRRFSKDFGDIRTSP